MIISEACEQIHKSIADLAKLNDPIDVLLPSEIYFFYEEGETCSHFGNQRIVRVGTHGAKRTLKRRLIDHYGGNREGSIFRKHLGTALLQRSGASNDQIKGWMRRRKGYELWKTFDKIEGKLMRSSERTSFFELFS